MILEKIRVGHIPAWPIFEVIPVLYYRDKRGKEYKSDIYYPVKKLTDTEVLEAILGLDKILPEIIEGKIEEEYEKVIILRDGEGNRYKFEKLD